MRDQYGHRPLLAGIRDQYEVLKEVFSGVPHHKIVLIVSHCGELTDENSATYKANVDKCVAFMFQNAPSVKYFWPRQYLGE